MAGFLNVVRFNPTAGSTTDWTFSAAVTGYQSPTAGGVVNGTVYKYRAESASLSEWEVGYGAYNTGTGVLARTTVLFNSLGTTAKINFSAAPQVAIVALAEDLPRVQADKPCGRLTLTSGTAVTTADVTAATSFYYTPSDGNVISLFDGSNWQPVTFTEVTVSIAGFAASTNFDVWGRISAGALAVDTTAWTNDTTRATAITTQDGIDVKSGDTTRRLLGTIRTTGTVGQTEDSHTKRFVSNRYNEQPRSMYATDPAASWNYSTATTRQANANTANQLDYVVCVSRPIWAHVQSLVVNSAGTNNVNVGIGIDSASGNSAQLVQIANLSGTTYVPTTATYTGFPGVGRHYVTWEEFGGGTNTQTWLATSANNIAGIIGEVAN